MEQNTTSIIINAMGILEQAREQEQSTTKQNAITTAILHLEEAYFILF